jgi:hypothetical protein
LARSRAVSSLGRRRWLRPAPNMATRRPRWRKLGTGAAIGRSRRQAGETRLRPCPPCGHPHGNLGLVAGLAHRSAIGAIRPTSGSSGFRLRAARVGAGAGGHGRRRRWRSAICVFPPTRFGAHVPAIGAATAAARVAGITVDRVRPGCW